MDIASFMNEKMPDTAKPCRAEAQRLGMLDAL
jgi:hypothetical protein